MKSSGPNYISGTPEELSDFTAQMNWLYNRPGLVVAGSVGRQAIYASFGVEMPPLSLRTPYDGYRDIDIVTVGRYAEDEDIPPGRHHVHYGLNAYHPPYYSSEPVISDGGACVARVDPAIFAPHERLLDGIRVNTYSVGTQLRLNNFVAVMMREREGSYQQSLQTFATFAEEICHSHPDEFLPAELYAPFDKVIAESRHGREALAQVAEPLQ